MARFLRACVYSTASILSCAASVALASSEAHAASPEKTFVIVSDAHLTEADANNFSDTVLARVLADVRARQAASEPLEAIIFTGDLVSFPLETNIQSRLTNWKTLVDGALAPTQGNAHLPPKIMAIRGNHEVVDAETDPTTSTGYQAWKAVFGTNPNVVYAPEGASYAFIGLDTFVYGSGGTKQPVSMDTTWLKGALDANADRTHLFVLGHAPAFSVGFYQDTLDNNRASRDGFVNLLRANGVRAYFAGHDHFYHNVAINQGDKAAALSDSFLAALDSDLHHFTTLTTDGIARAVDFSKLEADETWKLNSVSRLDSKRGYTHLAISGRTVTIQPWYWDADAPTPHFVSGPADTAYSYQAGPGIDIKVQATRAMSMPSDRELYVGQAYNGAGQLVEVPFHATLTTRARGIGSDVPVEWWCILHNVTNNHTVSYGVYNANTKTITGFSSTPAPLYSSTGIPALDREVVFSSSVAFPNGLPVGEYWLYYGVDTTVDGQVTSGTFTYDSVRIVKPSP